MSDSDGHDLTEDPPLVEVEPRPPKRAARAMIAGSVVVVLLAAAAGVWVLRDDSSPTARTLPALPLLDRGGESARSASADAAAPFAPIEYALAATLGDLGSTGVVHRVTAPRSAADAATAIAAALGIEGKTVEHDGVAEVAGADRTVVVSTYGPLTVSIYDSVPAIDPAAVGGEPGTAGVGSGAVGGDGSTDVPKEAPDVVEVPTIDAPENLPSAADAERIARELLNRIGVDGDYEAEVNDGGSVGIATACAPATDCPPLPDPIVTARAVTLFRTIDGQRVSGLEWYFDVGDEGVVGSINGTWASLETVGEYPLRSVGAAYEALLRGEVAGGRDLAMGAPDVSVGAPEIEPSPDVSVEPLRVLVSGATRGTIFMTAYEAGGPSAYLVPSYRFEGTFPDGTPWSAEVLAIDERYVVTPSTNEPRPSDGPEPVPVPPPDAAGSEPAPVSVSPSSSTG